MHSHFFPHVAVKGTCYLRSCTLEARVPEVVSQSISLRHCLLLISFCFMCGPVVGSFASSLPTISTRELFWIWQLLKMNYLLAKLISISQQEAIGPAGLGSVAVWLMDEHLLDAGTHTGTAAVPDFPFVLISCLQLVLGDLNGFIHGIVTWSH